MKYLKMLGLAAVAAMALMAFVGVGTASATTLCKTNVTTGCGSAWHYGVGTTIDADLTGSAILESSGVTLDTCTGGTIKGTTTTTGSDASGTTEGANVFGDIEEITWTGCSVETKTIATGTLEITHKAGTDEGTVTGNGSEVTVNSGFFGACVYGTTNTDVGNLKSSTSSTGHATIVISTSVPIKKNESGICPSTSTWTASYTVTEPKPLYISD